MQGQWFGGRICAEAMSCQVGRFGGILMDNVHLVVLVQSTDGSSRNRGGAACFRALPWLSRSVGHAGAMVWR